jgi:S1-C subfamily serine protease
LLTFIHLSGPRRGETDLVRALPAGIGSDPEEDVVVPGVAPLHAALLEREEGVVLQDAGSGAGTFLAGEAVQEAPLRDGDIVELGSGGPKLRFRNQSAPISLVRALSWARPEGAPDRLSDTTVFLRVFGRELRSRTTAAFRYTIAGLLLVAVSVVGFGVYQSARLSREVRSLRGEVQAAQAERRVFEQRVEEERRRARRDRAAFEKQALEFRQREAELKAQLQDATSTSGEVQSLRAELGATRERLTTLETERAAAEDIIKKYGAGVCLVQGSYAYYDASGRPLRYKIDEAGEAERSADGTRVLEVEGKGEVHTVEFFGTGFLVDRRGLVLTNRHIGQPWWNDATAASLEGAGFLPRLMTLRAFFPRETAPFDLAPVRHSERADLALLRTELRGRKIPVLPLARGATAAVAGHPVVLVGYPTGLEAILAKADSAVVREILQAHGTDAQRVTEALSQKGLIRPSTTQGHIGDVTKTDIVFDAPTTAGGSGGPVFNKAGLVVAVEYAVLEKFGGNSFGVPIRFVHELLAPPRKGTGR